MRLKFFGKTDIGRRRKMNQDSIAMDGKQKLFIVADGMGGHKGGEVASKLACETLKKYVAEHSKTPKLDPRVLLEKGFQEASRMVHLEANKPSEEEDLRGMGTTMVAIYVHEGRVYIANVGDSRAYLFTQGEIWAITDDHSLINEQLRAGIITEAESATVGKNVITRSIGFQPHVEVDIFDRKLLTGESYLLCSDGLHGQVTDEWILNRYKQGELDRFVEELVSESNNQGGDDNVSCLFVQVEP